MYATTKSSEAFLLKEEYTDQSAVSVSIFMSVGGRLWFILNIL